MTLLIAGCNSEAAENGSTHQVTNNPEPEVSLVPLAPGGGEVIAQTSAEGRRIMNDPAQIAQGKQIFSAMNCVGCHANGGGGMGPALMDKVWIYGGSIENIAASIREGRPNGMPSFRGFLPDEQVWQVAAYVHALSFGMPGEESKDTMKKDAK
ncbi:c-type cytochrome [Hyphomicrobium sp. 99]|uniref:c-type cytochrome n=1 Tax=Hyphomicrobium sp. 99 TaxID=1163419 RepID=UPI0006981912|nr:c-type cytochrome [Hyphomicrobium sp. 99]